MLTPEQAKKWAADLRSGTYTQGRGKLLGESGQRCCLMVLAEGLGAKVTKDEYNRCKILIADAEVVRELPNRGIAPLPESIMDRPTQRQFSGMNDGQALDFQEIATEVEKVFKLK